LKASSDKKGPRYPNWNAKSIQAYGSARMRWIEKDEPGEFRDANEYLYAPRKYASRKYAPLKCSSA